MDEEELDERMHEVSTSDPTMAFPPGEASR